MTDEQIKKIKTGEITHASQLNQDAFSEEYGVRAAKIRYVPPTVDDIRGTYANNEVLRKRALLSSIPFISSEVRDFKLSQGLILIGAKTGQGKSTTLANVLAGFMETKQLGDRALVITNEESTASVYNRIACVILKYSFKSFYNGQLPEDQDDEVQTLAQDLMEHIVVEEGNKQFDMTDSGHVKAALAYAAEGSYKLACLDYIQTVTKDAEHPDRSPIEVSKDLGFFLKDYGRKVTIPIVIFAQLHPTSEHEDFAQRVQNDRTIANHAFTAIEIVPCFETLTTKAIIHKNRFGTVVQGHEYVFRFEGGRLCLEF